LAAVVELLLIDPLAFFTRVAAPGVHERQAGLTQQGLGGPRANQRAIPRASNVMFAPHVQRVGVDYRLPVAEWRISPFAKTFPAPDVCEEIAEHVISAIEHVGGDGYLINSEIVDDTSARGAAPLLVTLAKGRASFARAADWPTSIRIKLASLPRLTKRWEAERRLSKDDGGRQLYPPASQRSASSARSDALVVCLCVSVVL
jgi:hypothetical protein